MCLLEEALFMQQANSYTGHAASYIRDITVLKDRNIVTFNYANKEPLSLNPNYRGHCDEILLLNLCPA
jgi:hypothetical protein